MNTEPTFQILNLATQETFTWTLTEILKQINKIARDRSEEWTDYNSEDWREGWDYWVEGEYYSMEGATRRDFI